MKVHKYFVVILASIIISITPSYAKVYFDAQESLTISESDLVKRSENIKESLKKFYESISEQFPNIEDQIDVTPENAPNVLACAVLMGGEVPKAHSLFEQFYDPYQHSMPETEEEAGFRADIIIGIQEQWPSLVEAIKIKNAVRKGPQDGIEGTPFCMDGMIRMRPGYANLTQSFYQPKQQAFVEVEDMDNVEQSFNQPRQRAFVERKNAWQEKYEPMWKRAKQHDAPKIERAFVKRKRTCEANESRKHAKSTR